VARTLFFITHPDVAIDPEVPVTDWSLSPRGRARMAAFCAGDVAEAVTSVWCSTERKAREGAEMLAAACDCAVQEMAQLGENDRSSTGYLPPEDFERAADAFFARPDASVRGWERAVDAQTRIVTAVRGIIEADEQGGDIALVAHGAVGALFLCARLGGAISRDHDQPGQGGGNCLACTLPDLTLVHSWRDIAPDLA